MDIEDMLTLIGEFVATECEEVSDVRYVEKSKGDAFYVLTEDGKRFLLTITRKE